MENEKYFIIFPRQNGKRNLQINLSPNICEYLIRQLPKNNYGPVYWKTNITKYIQNNLRP